MYITFQLCFILSLIVSVATFIYLATHAGPKDFVETVTISIMAFFIAFLFTSLWIFIIPIITLVAILFLSFEILRK